MSDWINCNLPYKTNVLYPEQYVYPDLDQKALQELGFNDAYLQNLKNEIFSKKEEDEEPYYVPNILDELSQNKDTYHQEVINHPDIRVRKLFEYREKNNRYNEWYNQQPEYVAYYTDYNARKKAFLDANAQSFCYQGLNKAGVLIEFEQDGKKEQRLIGHMNELGGVCDDCTEIKSDTIILRYRIVWIPEK